MEFPKEYLLMLEQFDKPAFFAKDTSVLAVNSKASAIGVQVQTDLATLFQGKPPQDNALLTFDTKLYGVEYTVTATPIGDATLYCLSTTSLTQQLQSVMRAAQQLRMPLSGLSSSIHLINTDKEDPNFATSVKHLHALQRAVRNMSDAALFLEDRSSKKEIVEIASYFEQTAQKLQQHFDNTDITISYSAFEEKLYSNVDVDLIDRAIYNMISNSLKADSKNLHLELKRSGNTLQLTVTDDGCGMTDEQKANILTRFKEQPGWTNQGYGLGLGMMIVFAAAKAHDGTLLIRNSEPHGCKITLTLAIQKGDTVLRQKPAALKIDPLGGADPLLLELADVLPAKDYM